MSDSFAEFDAQLAAFEGGSPAPEAEPATPTTATPAESISGEAPVSGAPEPSGVAPATSQPQAPVLSPEFSELVPETLRGATVEETLRRVAEDRKKTLAEFHKRNYDINRQAELEQRVRMQDAMIQSIQQRMSQPQQPAPQKPAFVDQLRQRGVNPEVDLIDRAPEVLNATADYAVEQMQQRFGETIQQYEARIQQLEFDKVAQSAERAFQVARPATISQDEWNAKAPHLAAYIKGMGWATPEFLGRPDLYQRVYGALYGAPPAPAPQQTAPAQPPVPTSAPTAAPAAPPIGAKPANTPTTPQKRQFRDKDRAQARELYHQMMGSYDGFEDLENDVVSRWENNRGSY